jgi:oxygen-independent coproporphyrinogen-3 oxidase
VAGRDYLVKRFLNALETEIRWLKKSWRIKTLFLGGGTPSHLQETDFLRLFDAIESRFSFAADVEITAECNPRDISAEKVKMLAGCGVNRISLGAQSFDAVKLQRLERDHDARQIASAVDMIRQRIDNLSLDLIFASPEETMELWQHDLESALKLCPDHLSTYELTYEKGTQFWNRMNRSELARADEDLCASMYEWTIHRLASAQMQQYEVSSFAMPDRRCRHNLQYWNRQPWFAFGPGAARFIDGIRQTNHGSTMQYLKLIESGQMPVADHCQLSPTDAAAEGLAIALRQIDGISQAEFEKQYGYSVDSVLGSTKATLLEHSLAEEFADQFRLTQKGLMVCDRIAVEIIGGAPSS